MKICTACNASYLDETLSLCPADGATLTPQKYISFDQVPFAYEAGNWSDEEVPAPSHAELFTNPEPPPVIASSFSLPPLQSAPPQFAPPPVRSANWSSTLPVIVGSVTLAIFVGVLIVASSNDSSSREPEVSVHYSGNTYTLANGARVRAVPMTGGGGTSSANTAVVSAPSSANSANANSTNTATNSVVTGKPISRKTDFTGIWTGEFGDEPTVLSITTQTGDSFSGTLSKKGYIIKVSGKIDFEKGTINFKETKVLQTPPNLNWNLGKNEGTVAESGKSMNGTGSDKNGYYEWSFRKG